MKVLVLAGGPDRERPVSLQSGKSVAEALEQAGHTVRQADIHPDQLQALDDFERFGGDVIFPALHGRWGEGGGLQQILEARQLPFVGCTSAVATLCMDKAATKAMLEKAGLPTPTYQTLTRTSRPDLAPPLVLKATDEGSSIGMAICHSTRERDAAFARLSQEHETLLAERFIKGREITVGVIEDSPGNARALPPLHIIPATAFYDYEAKYTREDTQYSFDIDLPATTLESLTTLAVATWQALGTRHLGRVDFIVDEQNQPWILEINTMPGFTSHSLLPKAAAHAGMDMPHLCEHLCKLAMQG